MVLSTLSNTSNSVEYLWFVYTQLSAFKYCYLILVIQVLNNLHTAVWFQVTNDNPE